MGELSDEIEWRDAELEKLTIEMAQLGRVKFGSKRSEQLDAGLRQPGTV